MQEVLFKVNYNDVLMFVSLSVLCFYILYKIGVNAGTKKSYLIMDENLDLTANQKIKQLEKELLFMKQKCLIMDNEHWVFTSYVRTALFYTLQTIKNIETENRIKNKDQTKISIYNNNIELLWKVIQAENSGYFKEFMKYTDNEDELFNNIAKNLLTDNSMCFLLNRFDTISEFKNNNQKCITYEDNFKKIDSIVKCQSEKRPINRRIS